MEYVNRKEEEDCSDYRIFDEMKKIVEEKHVNIIAETQIQENVESCSVNCEENKCSRNEVQVENINEQQYSSEPSPERTESVDIQFELLDPDNLTEIEENDNDTHSCIEELDNVIFIDYEKEDLLERDFWDCPYCPYKAKQLEFIHKHIVNTHASVTCYKCQDCQYAHAQLSLVMAHINRRHQKIKYQCPDCKFKFTTVWNCQGHILTRHPKKAQKLLQAVMKKRELDGNNRRCPFCQFTDNSPGLLKRHVERSHPEVIRFKCLYCTYKNIDTDDIVDHMKDMHPEENEDIDI